jgi:transcriptional regulator with XRE-family HTH domain
MNAGQKIKKIRELKNYTQQYMAQELNLSLSGYGKIERGEIDLSLGRIEQIATILGVDLKTILNFDENLIFNFTQNEQANGIVNNNYHNQYNVMEKLIDKYKEENTYLKELIKELTKK